MQRRDLVEKQYASMDGLQTRRMLYAKYEINPQSLIAWQRERIGLPRAARVLELGCGPGNFFLEWPDLPADIALTLTDFSQAMVDEAAQRAGERPNILCRQADIQAIPFADAAFDVVVVNYTLHHVPNIEAALREIARVLVPDGRAYISTMSADRSMHAFLKQAMKAIGEAPLALTGADVPFSLENGQAQLARWFARVECFLYESGVAVTDVADLLAYVASMTSFAELSREAMERLEAYFGRLLAQGDGVIRIPSNACTFVAGQQGEKGPPYSMAK